jgi:hypothetical protein
MNLNEIFAFWSPEMGANWNLVAAWAIVLFLTKGIWPKLSQRISGLLLKILNKIPLLKETELDEYVVGKLEERLMTMVSARVSEAKRIKTDYSLQISAAMEDGDYEKVKQLSDEMREDLEDLTKEVKDEFIDGEDFLWGLLQDRYGDKVKAGKWVVDKIKSLAYALKQPGELSTTAIIMKHLAEAAGELGKDS